MKCYYYRNKVSKNIKKTKMTKQCIFCNKKIHILKGIKCANATFHRKAKSFVHKNGVYINFIAISQSKIIHVYIYSKAKSRIFFCSMAWD